jgi:hypothetical protein
MRRTQIAVTERSTADPAAVYALLRDGASWPNWTRIESFELERKGEDEPEGVGAVRIYRTGRITGHDEITGLTEDRAFSYAHWSELPVRDYRGEVRLSPVDGGGTVIDWRVSYAPKFPGTGWVLRRGISRFIAETARGLARYAAAG